MVCGGEVPRVEVSAAAIELADGFDNFCNNVFIPLVAPYGGGLLRLTDCKLEDINPTTQLNVTAQQLIGCNEDTAIRVLLKGNTRQESFKHYQQQYDEGLARAQSLAEAVTDGLRFYRDIGADGGMALPDPTWYASDSQGTKAGEGKKAGSSIGQLFIDNLRFLFHFACVLVGITVGMFYVGYRNTIAAFHSEDAGLESLNYLFKGNAKQWVLIPGLWSSSLLNHLQHTAGWALHDMFFNKLLVLPTPFLDALGITYYTATQLQGWFVITTGFHQVRLLFYMQCKEPHVFVSMLQHALEASPNVGQTLKDWIRAR